MPPNRQAVKVIVSLVGLQNTAVVAHQPGTESATISVRVGQALIYLNDAGTAAHFNRVWTAGAHQIDALPMRADREQAMPPRG